MSQDPSGEVTRLLRELSRGKVAAEADLIPLVYDELRRLASRFMSREQSGHTLQTTALVHEAYLRLVRAREVEWQDRAHFFAVAATVMRRILVDHARSRQADRRGGTLHKAPLDENMSPSVSLDDPDQVLALDDALNRLAVWDPRQCRIVELRFFSGMTVDETAEILKVSPRTIKREWRLAKAWLYGELTRTDARPQE